MMKIYIIRHGETDANRAGCMQGSSDWPLNSFGKELAVITGKAMKNIHFDACYSSPLSRARQTAKLVLENSDNMDCPIIYDDRLKEINAGDMEGKYIHHLESEKDRNIISRFFNSPNGMEPFPNGENIEMVKERTNQFFHEILLKNHETVLISTHGCALRAMLNFLYENPDDFWQGHPPFNCAVSLITYENDVLRLIEKDRIYYDPALSENFYNVK